jgi:excisionase family DNA binding protein
MTVKEAATKLEVSPSTIRQWITTGEIRAVNLSRDPGSRKPRMRITQEELDKFLLRRSTQPPVKATRRARLPEVGNWDL